MKKRTLLYCILLTVITAFAYMKMYDTYIDKAIGNVPIETNIALADLGYCLEGAFENREIEAGTSCYCTESEQWVTSQECVGSGSGCTEIDCTD